MPLVVQSFGNEIEYRRAILCVLSYYAHSVNPMCIFLFTDNPSYFEKYLGDIKVKYFLLTADVIKSMRGEIDFLHRIKIEVIEHALKNSDEVLLYVDSDTFFKKDPMQTLATVQPSVAFMHVREYPFSHLRNATYPGASQFYQSVVENKFYDASGKEVSVSESHDSWNAGVIIIHHDVRNLLNDVYTLTDQFFRYSESHASEQYAFSVILQNSLELRACDDIIYHYWYRIKKNVVDQVLKKRQVEMLVSNPHRLSFVKVLTQKLPRLLETHEWILRDKSIQSFHENQWKMGYKFALYAICKNPFNAQFLKDVLCHTKRLINE